MPFSFFFSTTNKILPISVILSISNKRRIVLWTRKLRNFLILLLTAFSRFSRLLTKIRVKIWHYAMPRVVYIGPKDANYTSKNEQSKYPVLLVVNRESREVALKDLKRYTKFLDKNPIYVDFGLDIFYISCFDTSGLDNANYDSYIQVLALNSKYFANSLCKFLQMVRRCSHLWKLVLVMLSKETAL
jgi:2EXR family